MTAFTKLLQRPTHCQYHRCQRALSRSGIACKGADNLWYCDQECRSRGEGYLMEHQQAIRRQQHAEYLAQRERGDQAKSCA